MERQQRPRGSARGIYRAALPCYTNMAKIMGLLILATCAAAAKGQGSPTQLEMPTTPEDKQRRQFDTGSNVPNLLPINAVTGSNRAENAAILQLKADRAAFPFLSTLPNKGSSVFITTLKPCGIILPHIHPRATEQYLIIAGQMQTGLAEETSGLPNITAIVNAGSSFVAPQGLLHYNANRLCTPLVFAQIFDSTDPGTVTVINSLAALAAVDPKSLEASNAANVTASQYGPVNLDTKCLLSCGIVGSSGGGLGGLTPEMQVFLGLTSPAPAASG